MEIYNPETRIISLFKEQGQDRRDEGAGHPCAEHQGAPLRGKLNDENRLEARLYNSEFGRHISHRIRRLMGVLFSIIPNYL